MNDTNLTESDIPAIIANHQDSIYLTDESKSLMRNVASEIPAEDQSPTILHLLAIERATEEDYAVYKLAGIINSLVAQNLAISTLVPLCTSNMIPMPKTHPGVIVHCNILVPRDMISEVQAIAKGYYYDPALYLKFETLIKELPVGQFYCNIGISLSITAVKGAGHKQLIDEEVENILRLLPKGTNLVSLRECGIVGLAVPYEAIFSHELMTDFKEVEIEYVYRFVEVNGKYKNIRLPVKLKYIAREGYLSEY